MATPAYEFRFGKKLTEQEALEYFENHIETSEEYQKVLAELVKTKGTKGKVEIFAANTVEVPVSSKEIATATRVMVKIGNEVIDYISATKENNSKELVLAAMANNEGQLTSLFTKNGELTTNVYEEMTFAEFLAKDFHEGLPNQEDYVIGQSLEEINTKAWGFFDGICYPGYRHCGKGCGDNGTSGGGTPVNGFDECCRAHDRCWANFGTGYCQCDCNILSCTTKYAYLAPTGLILAVAIAFPYKDSCKC